MSDPAEKVTKARGKGQGSHAEAGDESLQDTRLADFEDRLVKLEAAVFGVTSMEPPADEPPVV